MTINTNPVTPELANIANVFINGDNIADEVFPRYNVPRQSFEYVDVDPKNDKVVVAKDAVRVGVDGDPQTTRNEFAVKTASADIYAHIRAVPLSEVRAVGSQGVTPTGVYENAVSAAANFLNLAREQRTYDLLSASGTYASGQNVTVQTADKWSADASDPIKQVQDAMVAMPTMPNVLVMGATVFYALRRHPNIIKSRNRNDGGSGLASAEEVATALGVDRVVVGRNRKATGGRNPRSTAKKAVEYIYGNFAALLKVGQPGTLTNPDDVFGVYALVNGSRMTMSWDDPRPGGEGVRNYKVTEMGKELVINPFAGYLFTNPIA